MSQYIVKCPHCKQFFKAKEEWIGEKIKCQSCENAFIVEQLRKRRTPFVYGSIMPNIIMIWVGAATSILTFIFACGVYWDKTGFHVGDGNPLGVILGRAIPGFRKNVIDILDLEFDEFCVFAIVVLIVVAFFYCIQVARVLEENNKALFLKIEAISALSSLIFPIVFSVIVHKYFKSEDGSITPAVSFYLGVVFIVFSVVSIYAKYVTLRRKQPEFKNISIEAFIKKMRYMDA